MLSERDIDLRRKRVGVTGARCDARVHSCILTPVLARAYACSGRTLPNSHAGEG